MVAEFLTAILLLIGGLGLLTDRNWGVRADLAALGMLFYCTVFSIGVFGQQGNIPATIFFILMAMSAVIFSTTFILESAKGGAQ